VDARSLVALAAVLVVLVSLVSLTAPPAAGPQGGALPRINGTDVSRLVVEGSGGRRVTLARSGAGWGVEEAGGWPASQGSVDGLLRAVEGMGPGDLVGRNATKHALYELDDGSATRLKVEAGGALFELLVGKMGPSFESTFVRLPRSDEVRLAASPLWALARPERRAFLERSLVRCEPGDVAYLALNNGTRRARFAREGGNWTADPPGSGDPSRVDEAVRAACSLDLYDVAQGAWEGGGSSAELGLPSGSVRVELGGDEGGGLIRSRVEGKQGLVVLPAPVAKALMAPLTG
jgi:hypothetical protein